ncbi:NAD(P)H-binding protein [Streptomyces sp. CB03911]|uniref:NAD(P)-dependent oxidoreductase n=1 Tax=Streptomyces sp. CB03911 TaxID=1804758 RepID=UPI00093A9C47|nr:NAD(P)H-binding protein [Streptomyces sp. CB03911]OKI20621.1 NAD-dependent epimerase [Streptomyces sp. CB03911]
MRIVVLGATGPTGRELTEQALAAGHQVTAVARRAAALPPRAGLTTVAADVTAPGALDAAVEGGDAVVSALGAAPGRRPVDVYSAGVRNAAEAMARHGVKRLLAVGSSVTDPAWRPSGAFFFNNVLDPYVNRVIARTAHEDMRRMEAVLAAGELDWTVARPSGLFDHPVVTDFQVTENSGDGVFTARADLAAAMLRELAEGRFVRKAMGVVTTEVRPSIPRLIWREATRKK